MTDELQLLREIFHNEEAPDAHAKELLDRRLQSAFNRELDSGSRSRRRFRSRHVVRQRFARWHFGRSTTIALVVGLMLTGSAAAGVLIPTPTTIPSPGASAALAPPPGAQPLSSLTVPPSETLVPEGAPAVASVATTACNSSDVSATLGGSGPYNDNPATAQGIISLSATSPCLVSGYAELKFSSESGAAVQTTVVDGGYTGASHGVSNVSLGSSNEGSFLFQYSEALNGVTSDCPLETSLSVEIPNQSLTLNVNLRGVGLMVCGPVNVSPIIQGNSTDRYVS
jgi:hypothetical protein